MQGREYLHCHHLAILQTLSGFSGYRRCRWLRHFTASGQWSERFTDYCEPTLVVGRITVEVLVDDVFNEVADAVTGSPEDSGNTLDTIKRVIAFPPISAALGIIQASLILLSLAREVLIATRCLLPLLSLIFRELLESGMDTFFTAHG